MKTLAKYFFQGLLYITPISVTVYVLFWVFRNLDSMIEFPYPGLGVLVLLVVITAVGLVGSYLIQLPIFSFIDNRLERAPLIKIIYTSVKDLIKAFVGQKKNFNRPVLVKLYENSELRRLGFVTDEALTALDEDTHLTTVYVPHSFAISGQLFLVPPSYISPIKSPSPEVMKYIIAGGVAKIDEDDEIIIK
jgi:uncharacterized membrane protein